MISAMSRSIWFIYDEYVGVKCIWGQGNIRAEGGGNLPSDGGAPAGEIPEQRYRGRSWPT